MEHKDIEELIVDYLDGELDEEGKKQLLHWCNESEENRKRLREWEELWASAVTRGQLDGYDWRKAYDKFAGRVANQDTSSNRRPHLYKWVAGIAASLLVLFTAAYVSYQKGQKDLATDFSDIFITTPEGSNTSVTLPDGTSVVLNAGSKLSYSQGFGVKDRTVSITGEGYFTVAKDSRKPFTVTSGSMRVKVLGTKFNYRDYPTDGFAEVVLDEGKVNITDFPGQRQGVTLIPHQRAALDKRLGKLTVSNVDPAIRHTWTDGVLSFTGQSLGVIALTLERSYHVTITFADDTKRNLHFYGDFYRDSQSVREVMDALSATGKISYKIKGREIVIY